MTAPLYCVACRSELGDGPDKERPAVGTKVPMCLECAWIFDPPELPKWNRKQRP